MEGRQDHVAVALDLLRTLISCSEFRAAGELTELYEIHEFLVAHSGTTVRHEKVGLWEIVYFLLRRHNGSGASEAAPCNGESSTEMHQWQDRRPPSPKVASVIDRSACTVDELWETMHAIFD